MLLVAPDAELVAIGVIRAALARSRWAGTVVARDRPSSGARVVTVQRAGGGGRGLLDEARLLLNVWANSEKDVADLSADVRAALEAARGHDPVIRCTVTGPTAVPETGVPPNRFMTAVMTLRKEPR